eukprot:13233-Heterococcus_DN1.PRE.2
MQGSLIQFCCCCSTVIVLTADERTDEEKLLRGLAKIRELDMKLACKASHVATTTPFFLLVDSSIEHNSQQVGCDVAVLEGKEAARAVRDLEDYNGDSGNATDLVNDDGHSSDAYGGNSSSSKHRNGAGRRRPRSQIALAQALLIL